ncbi:putative RNA helicase armitage isoform X2 [Lasioglossum baleicum]|uniref:putative RNA helicase armitage isoform X2 n=1 Tax=Lasioglossum baleicum TaxID=434251 RepID=UPI003FCD0615
MLSLIYTIVKHVVGHKSSIKSNDVDEMNDVVARIENAYEKDIKKEEYFNKNGGCYKTGKITFVATDYVMVDNFYVCDRGTISAINNLEVGDKVYYSTSKEGSENQCKIKIICVIDESWDDSAAESQTELTETRTLSACKIGKVIECKKRQLIVDPHDIRVNLNDVQSEFIPVIGDWLQIEADVETDSNCFDSNKEILKIKRIQPLRSKFDIGTVSSYDSVKEIGTIDKDIVFNKRICDSGYIPCVGDKVVHDSIESDQGFYTWRSLTVVPIAQVSKKYILPTLCNIPITKEDLNELVKNKSGIVITSNLNVDLNVLEEKDVTVTIENTSDVPRVLEKGYFKTKKAQSQLELVQPRKLDATSVLNPSTTLTYIFKCKAKFVGPSKELFVFSFTDFEIGRVFRITVSPKSIERKIHSKTSNSKPSNKYIPNSNEWSDSTYIPGVRPCKPPSFIKVRNTLFKVPKHYWDLILECINERKSHTETTNDIGGAVPVLLERLTFHSYKDRFHALLYLEEIAQELEIQRYSIESVIMRPRGEYLAMEVPGLAEKRPSLIVGDRAMVSFKWDSTQGSRKYEGFIHKVTSSEIFLKFTQKFHEDYNGEDCQVTFKCSKTGLQRCHNAINVAINRLGSNFLFPTRVIEKDSQLNLQEIDLSSDAAPKSVTHQRTDSISSESSSTSTNTSTSNKSKGNTEPAINSAVTTKGNRQSIGTNVTRNETSIENHLERVTPVPPENTELEPYISQVRKRKLIWFNKNLNYYQKEAVRNILKGHARPLPYVIFGPPGTGKTITLCEAILQILSTIPSSRLLIATPSNSSANLIAERLLDSGTLNPGDMVRLVAHHCLGNDSIPEKLLSYCATAELGEERTCESVKYNGVGPRLSCNVSTLGRHRITIGTCIALGILHNIGFPHGHFTHVLIDEAGQATEPEIMIPLNFTHSDHGQVVLAGDPLQLGPVVQSKIAKSFGLDESFLVRLLRHFPYQRDPNGFQTHYDPRLVTKLVINYRSLPEIVELSSSMFYDSELVAQVSPERSKEAKLLQELSTELPEREGSPPAIVFHGINGKNCRDNDSPSWYNPEEATQVYLYLLKLYECGISPDDIGIITPYQKQVLEVRDLLMQLDVQLPKISSVEGFQGQERNVIIISAVRSSNDFVHDDIRHSLGFVACPRRLNVAITRARALVIILGNPRLLSQDPYWRNVLTYCINHDSYTGCSFLFSGNTQQAD